MGNSIINFVATGGNLLSPEGEKMILDVSRLTIKKAVVSDFNTAIAIKKAREASKNPLFRRKILLALSE